MLTLASRFERFAPFMREAEVDPVRVHQVYGPADTGGAVMSETDQVSARSALALLERSSALERAAGALRRPVPEKAPKSTLPMALQWGARSGGAGVGVGRPDGSVAGVFCSQPTYRPTAANLCLEGVSRAWEGVYQAGGLAPYCRPDDPLTCGVEPWKQMPSNGKRFQKTGSIPRPAVEGVDTLVLSFRVPNAWDGVLITVTNQWDGAGFVDGSGDLIWGLMYDQQWFKDLDDIRITMGRLENPYELEGAGYRLLTNRTIRYFVRLGAGALGRLDPNGRITCACSGWFYPRS